MLQKVPFATHFYQSRSLPLSAQRVVNLYAETAPPTSKSNVVLIGTPGQVRFSDLSDIRQMHVMNEVLYAVSGTELYSVAKDGVGTFIGEVPDSDFITMDDNGIDLAICTNPKVSLYNPDDGLRDLSDPDFPGASSVTSQDGYLIFTRPNSGEFFISRLLAAGDIDALDYATAETKPDNLVRAFSDHRELWLFGERTIEVWYNSGSADFPFERISSVAAERGCASKETIAKLDNTVFWLGDDLIVYRAEGYKPTRISTHPIEHAIAELDPETAFAFTYSMEGHAFYVLSFKGQITLVYDAATGLWHERESYALQGWSPSCYAQAYGKHLVGGDAIYELSLNSYTDDGKPLITKAISVPYGDNTDQVLVMPSFQLDIETGVGKESGEAPQAMLRFSNDGRNWSNEIWTDIGRVGEYQKRAVWRRLGSFRYRVIEVSISDPVKRVIMGGFAEVSNG